MKLAVEKIDDPQLGQIWCSPQPVFAKTYAETWLLLTTLRDPPSEDAEPKRNRGWVRDKYTCFR